VLLLLFAGLVFMLTATVFVVRHPRATGEPFSTRRKLYLCLNVVGAMLVIIYAVSVSGGFQ